MSTKFSPPARLLKALRWGKTVVNRAERIPRLKRPTFEDCVEPEPLGNPGIGPNAETVVGRNQLILGSLRPDQYQRSVADDDSEVALPRDVRPVVPDIARRGDRAITICQSYLIAWRSRFPHLLLGERANLINIRPHSIVGHEHHSCHDANGVSSGGAVSENAAAPGT